MLQDVDAGRPVELDALLAAVHEIGLRLGVPTPTIDDLLGLTRLAARVRGLYPEAGEPAAGFPSLPSGHGWCQFAEHQVNASFGKREHTCPTERSPPTTTPRRVPGTAS